MAKETPHYPWYSMFVRSGHLLALAIIIVMVAGLSAIQTLPRLEDPRIDLRNALILTAYPAPFLVLNFAQGNTLKQRSMVEASIE